MLMQSSDGAVHLLPALPDVWISKGSITGLRAPGGFEIVSMQWKEGKLAKLVIKSNLGGNLRLRLPNEMRMINGAVIVKAAGENTNPFYKTEETAAPVISPRAKIEWPKLQKTWLYDISTQKGVLYTMINN
jgi:alpha-L-fucosidase 2